MDLSNKVILVKSMQHGKEVVKFFKDNGYNTGSVWGSCAGNYYGIISGKFDLQDRYEVELGKAEIIELPSIEYIPFLGANGVMMEVSDDGRRWFERSVIGKTKLGKIVIVTEDDDVYSYDRCRPITNVREVSFDMIAELLGVDPKNLKITK